MSFSIFIIANTKSFSLTECWSCLLIKLGLISYRLIFLSPRFLWRLSEDGKPAESSLYELRFLQKDYSSASLWLSRFFLELGRRFEIGFGDKFIIYCYKACMLFLLFESLLLLSDDAGFLSSILALFSLLFLRGLLFDLWLLLWLISCKIILLSDD